MSDATVLTREQVEQIQKSGVNIFVARKDELYLTHEPRHKVYAEQANVVRLEDYAALRSQRDALAEALRDLVNGFGKCLEYTGNDEETIAIRLQKAQQALAAAPEAGKP